MASDAAPAAGHTGGQFLRFVIVGLLATGVHWGVYLLINTLLSISPENETALAVSYGLGYIISFIGNYLASLKWTFKTRGNAKKGLGFALSHAINLGLHVSFLKLFLHLRVGTLLVSLTTYLLPSSLLSLLPLLSDPTSLTPLPVFLIVIPINFLLVRYALRD